MKKGLLTILAIMAMSLTANAADSKISLGLTLGGFNGASLKAYNVGGAKNFAITTDLGFKVTNLSQGQNVWLECNPNFLCQKSVASFAKGSVDFYFGGGISLGLLHALGGGTSGKFGTNTIFGVEVPFKSIPLAVGLDFRPGYGLSFVQGGHSSFFDWSLGASIRYIFK